MYSVKQLNQMDSTLEYSKGSDETAGCHNLITSNAKTDINTYVETPKSKSHSPPTNGASEPPNKMIKLNELAATGLSTESSHEKFSKAQDESPIGLIDVNQTTVSIKEETHINKLSKTATSVPSESKEEILSRSGREVGSIIDGSDLRQFLNKTLSTYLVEGLDEIVNLWENGEFEVENQNDNELKRKVVEKFANILKLLANR